MAGGGFASKDPRRLVQSAPVIFAGPNNGLHLALHVPSLSKINELGGMRIRFRFVLMTKVNGREELWMILRIACGWTLPPVARIPQITSLRPGKP
jgi:hypothetical protein